jgi:hypothetical protein
MQKTIFDDLRHFNKNATDSTIKMYSNNIIKVCKDLGHDINDCKPSIFKPKEVFELLQKQKATMNTEKNKLVSILVYLQSKGYNKDIIEQFNNRIYILLGKLRNEADKNQYTEKEKDNLVSMEELTLLTVKLKKELPSVMLSYRDFEKYMEYIIVSTNIKFPLRSDWAELKMVSNKEYSGLKDSKQFNYMVIDNEKHNIKCYINKYKTSKTHGTIEFESDDKNLVDIIYKYYKNVKEYYEDSDKMFEHSLLWKRNFEPMSRNLYSRWLSNIFFKEIGKKININLIRKISTSEIIDGETIKKFKELARVQGHSLMEALSAYTKN